MSHDNSKPVGRMKSINSASDGLYASFKISSSSRGNDAILLAQEQLMDGLSVGVEVTASEPKDNYLLVTAATLREVSLVESAAFASAAVQKISAQEGDMPLDAAESTSTKITTTNTVINSTTTETETESEAAVTTAPDQNAPEAVDATEQAAPTVEAARKIILPSALNSQRVRTPITSMGAYTEHKIKAALGNEDSKLYVTAADDTFANNPAFSPTQYLSEFPTNTRFGTPSIDACSRGVLPASGMTINVPSLVTSAGGKSGVAPVVTVEAEGGAVANTGMVTEYLSGTISNSLASGYFDNAIGRPDLNQDNRPYSVPDPTEPLDNKLGNQLISLGLVESDTLIALMAEAKKTKKSLRQALLNGGYLTFYQLALIEAGNINGLMIDRFRVIDKLPSTSKEYIFQVFDPIRKTECLLRHLSESELSDPYHPDEFRQRFSAAINLHHENVGRAKQALSVVLEAENGGAFVGFVSTDTFKYRAAVV